MSEQESKENVSTSSTSAVATTTTSFDAIHRRQRIAQNFLLIWVYGSIDESTEHYQNTLTQLQSVVNDINIFTKWDEAIDFLTEIHEMKAFLVIQDTMSQHILPLIHDIPQLDAIYISCDNKSEHEQWTNEWIKIKDVYTDIKPICQALQQAAKQYNQDSITMSFISMAEATSSQNLEQLEPSFMYTQIFKEILLEMEHNELSIKDFVQFWRDRYVNNTYTLKVIDEFEKNYCPQSSIRWYTREYFIYQMLNQSLRTLEADTIINMGFFIRDLHQQIQELHRNDVSTNHEKSFKVYRGQGLLKSDFEKLVKSKGGLLSFNNFLSTSDDPDVPRAFAESAATKTNTVGILFKMTIDPSVSSAPFASIREVSYFQTEEEILFSMHTVFRIGEINKIDNNDSLYEVDLTLTADDDQELRTLTEHIRNDVEVETGWKQLCLLLVKIGHFDKAEELCNVLLEQTSDESEKATYYNNLGSIKDDQCDYQMAIEYYEKALEIRQKTFPQSRPHCGICYNNIGTVYLNMGEYLKALSFYEKAIEIRQKTFPPNHPALATSYNNIGTVYYNMGEYSQALSFFKKGLEIYQETLPPNHPDLALSYNNIGSVYDSMGEYLEALSFYEKAIEIRQKTLPPNHPDLVTSYNNIGTVYYKMGEYSQALSFFEKGLDICQKTLPPNHPDLAICYNSIGSMYVSMGEYLEAFSFYDKALDIRKESLPPNHPDLATSYNNIGLVCSNMEGYSTALWFYEKDLEICQKTLPPNHPNLATSYNNIGSVYDSMGEYSKALEYLERAQNIWQSSLPSNHPSIKTVRENIEFVKKKL